jgi:minor extracellular serine protease Vpr
MLFKLTRRKAAFSLALASLVVAAPFAAFESSAQNSATGYAIVELASPAAVHYRGGIRNIPSTAPANFRAVLNRRVPQASIVRSFHATANAVAIELNGVSPSDLKKLNGAKKVHEVTLYRPNMDQSVDLINAPGAWANVGGRDNAGAGVRVSVIDSGIVNSLIPGFQPFFNCKNVEFGDIYFSGVTGAPAIGIKNENGAIPAPGVAYVSDHGTHVAGTTGGCVYTIGDGSVWDGTTLSGVAPGATLVDRNVFPGIGAGFTAFGGSAFSHDIAAAIEDSVVAGDQVINMSLGGGVQGPNDFLAQVSDAAVAAGVVVVTSAGNEGPGAFTIGSPGSAANVISVGATTNSRGMGVIVTAPGFDPINAVPGEFPDFDSTDQVLIDWPGSDNLVCSSDVADGSLSGEVVLIERGACSFSQKMANAKAAGAGGAIVFTDDRGVTGMARTAGFDDLIPAVMVARDDGLALEGALAGGALSPTTITPPTIVAETPNELAGFSSRGPVPFTGIVKPDVVAPGVNVLSSVFFGFELFNGTSMASPHVAGASAVLLQANTTWSPAMVKSAIATTATDLGLAPWEQGSGLMNLEAAMNTNTFFAPTNASFGVFVGKAPANASVDIAMSGAACSVSGASGPFVAASIDGGVLTVEFNGGREAPSGNHGGYVTLDCGGQSHTIPWGVVVDR